MKQAKPLVKPSPEPGTAQAAREEEPMDMAMSWRVVERYVSGETGTAIARDLGIPNSEVYRLLRAAAVRRRPPGRPRDRRLDPGEAEAQQVIERYQAGQSATAIASELQVPKDEIYRLLRSAGVSIRTPGPLRGRLRPANEARAQRVIERYQAGQSGVKIARELGIRPATIYTYLRQAGVTRSRREANRLSWKQHPERMECWGRVRRKGGVPAVTLETVTLETRAEVKRRYEAGETYHEIAERVFGRKYGSAAQCVLKILDEAGVPRRNPGEYIYRRWYQGSGPLDWPQTPAVIERHLAGESPQQIARDLQVGVWRICKVLDAAGMPRYRGIDPARRQQAIDQYRSGEPIRAILQNLSISEGSLYRWLKQAGVPPRTPGRR